MADTQKTSDFLWSIAVGGPLWRRMFAFGRPLRGMVSAPSANVPMHTPNGTLALGHVMNAAALAAQRGKCVETGLHVHCE